MKTAETTEKLTSVKLQPMININKLNVDLWCPVLRFGRKKAGEFRFPIVFKNHKQAQKLYEELSALKGKSLSEVKKLSNKLYDKFKKFHYKNN